MSIEISEATRGLWFVELPKGDWMASLEALDGERFRIIYRFRWVRDKKIFDTDDVKEWDGLIGKGTITEGIEHMRAAVHRLQLIGAGKVTELLRENLSLEDFFDLLRHQKFAHTRKLTQAEYEAEYGPLPADVLARAQRQAK
jgi:hypothetical protein